MAWSECRRRYSVAKLDEAYVGQALGIPPAEVSPRLHKLKHSLGLRGRPVLICLDDGAIYLNADDQESIGSLFDWE
jgi:hypothetical protein